MTYYAVHGETGGFLSRKRISATSGRKMAKLNVSYSLIKDLKCPRECIQLECIMAYKYRPLADS